MPKKAKNLLTKVAKYGNIQFDNTRIVGTLYKRGICVGRLSVITSGKGGVGKSTVAVGLAAAVACNGRSVLLVDADEGIRCLDLLLGVSGELVFDLGDVLSGAVELQKAVYPVKGTGISLLAAPRQSNVIRGEQLGELLLQASEQYDHVILDCPAGLDHKYYHALPAFAQLLVVCNADRVSVRDAAAAVELLQGYSLQAGFILNRFLPKGAGGNQMVNIDDLIDTVGARLFGVIPEDRHVPVAASKGVPLVAGRAAMALGRVAARLYGQSIPLPNVRKL